MDNLKAKVKIGIPRALLYHEYYELWKSFFEKLNCQIIVSPETNKEILERGVNLAVDESCLSLKIFLGHVDFLKDKADYILIPHIQSLYGGEEICVKLISLYDIARGTFKDLKLLEYSVDVRRFKIEFFGFLKLGWKFSKNPFSLIKAYIEAKGEQKKHKQSLIREQEKKLNANGQNNTFILVVSHPYTTYDGLIGKPIIKFLESQGVKLIYADRVDETEARKLSKNISSDLYWTYNKKLLGGLDLYKDRVNGIIFLMTFPCGPDALVVNICQNKLKKPSIVITIDELWGEAGLKTRIESFVDIIKLRKQSEAKN